MDDTKIIPCRRVPVVFPAKRCVVCGDKIKDGDRVNNVETMIELIDYHGAGQPGYLEDWCAHEFQTGLKSKEPDAFKHGGKLEFQDG